jgi:hypothetical protein
MRKQTILIKEILKKHFPSTKCSVRFVQAHQYVDTSDKIIVIIDNADYNQIYAIINSYTKGIKICKKGFCVSITGLNKPEIYNIHTKQFEDADLLEFIEID